MRVPTASIRGAAGSLAALLCVAVLPVLAAACDGGRSSRDVTGPADVAGARAQIDKFRGLPEFVPPGPAFDAARELRGKTIFEIPMTSEVPFVGAVERGMRQAAEAVGAKLVLFPNQGQPVTRERAQVSVALPPESDNARRRRFFNKRSPHHRRHELT